MNYYFEFELSSYDSTQTTPNVKVCLYSPATWADPALLAVDGAGGLTGASYAAAAACAEDTNPPAGYNLIGAREAKIGANAFGDSLNLAFRLAQGAVTGGKILARVFEKAPTGWARTEQSLSANLAIASLPAGPPVFAYVASAPGNCNAGGYTPCYVNSRDDLPNGLGTGLKDAIDALPGGATIYLVGSYPIKSNAVTVNKALVIDGVSDAGLTYTGAACAAPMLAITRGATVRDLDINDGSSCSQANRTLIDINSQEAVLIESNRLSAGDTAIYIHDNAGGVTVRFNQIEGNSGQAIFWDTGAGAAPLEVVANNIVGNGQATSGAAIECGAGATAVFANRKANHNYWGSITPPTQDATHCTIVPGKQLGAPIAASSSGPGVNALKVTVTQNKTYAFNDQVAYQRTGGDADFDLYLVDHGFADNSLVPFTGAVGPNPNPCSDFYDVFLPDGVAPSSTLELFLKYDKSPACLAAINSTALCDQTDKPEKYPLWWYDPAGGVTNFWDTTGQKPDGTNAGNAVGQATTCHIGNNEIQVSIDNEGRPARDSDLSYTPFMTGVKVLKSFSAASSSGKVTLTWSTAMEPDITGFYVLRGLDVAHMTPIIDLMEKTGDATTGDNYAYIDSNRTSGTVYYYRLKIMRSDGTFIYSQIAEVTGTVNTATPTPSPTSSPTATNTHGPTRTYTPITPTKTNLPTLIPTQVPTRIPSRTATLHPPTATRPALTLLPTDTPPALETSQTLSASLTAAAIAIVPSSTATIDESGYPAPENETSTPSPSPQSTTSPTARTRTPGSAGTSQATPSITQTILGGDSATHNGPLVSPYASLLTGFSIGMVLLGLLGAWLFILRRKM